MRSASSGPKERTTFFVELGLARIKLDCGRANWQLARAEIVGPEGW